MSTRPQTTSPLKKWSPGPQYPDPDFIVQIQDLPSWLDRPTRMENPITEAFLYGQQGRPRFSRESFTTGSPPMSVWGWLAMRKTRRRLHPFVFFLIGIASGAAPDPILTIVLMIMLVAAPRFLLHKIHQAMRPHYDEIRMTGYSLPQYSSEINAIVDRIVLWRYLPLALAGWIIGMILGPMLAQTGTSDKILVGLILWAVCMLSNWLQRTAHWQSFSGTQSGAISATVWSVFTILLMLIAIPIIIAIESSQSHGGGAYRGGMGFLHWYVLMALLQAQSPYSPHKPAKPETRIKLYRDVLPGYWPDSQSPS